jgi:hypothetical protein
VGGGGGTVDLGGSGSSGQGRAASRIWGRGVVRVSEGSGWCGVRVSVGSGLDRVGADFRPFRSVGSAQMYGEDGPVRDNLWEGRY